MAERVEYLTAVVGMDITQFRRGSANIRNEFGLLSENFKRLGKLAQAGTYLFTTPMVALGTASVGAYTQFDASMQNINAIAQLSGAELDALSDKVRAFGETSRSGVTGSANALYTVFSAGITDVSDAFNIMEVSSKTAEAGLADLEITTEALVASLLSYNDVTPEFANRASDALTNMVAVGVGSMSDFANSVANVLPSASALGMSIEELYGDLAFLTQRGFSASKASTALNSALTALSKPTEAMQTAFRKLGVNGAEELITQFGGVNEAMVALYQTTDGTQDQIQALFNNIRGARAINTFMQDIDAWRESQEHFNETLQGATNRAWEQQMQSLSAKFDLLKSAGQSLLISIGSAIEPFLTPIVEALTNIFLAMANAGEKATTFAVAIGGVVSAMFPLTWIITSLLNPFNMLIAVIGAFSTAFTTNIGGVRDTVIGFVDDLTGGLDPVITAFDDLWNAVFPPEAKEFTPLSDTPISLTPEKIFTVDNLNTSLWSTWESEFSEYFSWDEFYKKAKEAGWTGELGVDEIIKIDMSSVSGFVTTTMTGISEEAKKYLQGHDLLGLKEGLIPEDAPNVFDRIFANVGDFWTAIKPTLDTAWNNFIVWADGKAGEGLNTLAGIFGSSGSSEGKTSFYDSIVNFFTADIGGAVSEGIEGALPNATAGFGNLISNIGTWLIEDGIPTIARSIGFFAGRIAVLLGTALDMLRGGGITDTANTVGNYVEDGIADPLVAGWLDATSGLEGQIAGDALSDFVGSIGDWFATEALPAVAWGVGKFVGSLGLFIGDAFGAIFNGGTIEGAGNVLGDVVESFSAGFQDATQGRELSFGDTIVTGILGAIATAFTAKLVFSTFLGKGVFTAIGSGLSMGSGLITGALSLGWSLVSTIASGLYSAIFGGGLSMVGGWIASSVGISIASASGLASIFGKGAVVESLGVGLVSAIGSGVSGAVGILTTAITGIIGVLSTPAFIAGAVASVTVLGVALVDAIANAYNNRPTTTYGANDYDTQSDTMFSAIDELSKSENLPLKILEDGQVVTLGEMQAIVASLPEPMTTLTNNVDGLSTGFSDADTKAIALGNTLNTLANADPLLNFKVTAIERLTAIQTVIDKLISAFNTITGFNLSNINLGGVFNAVVNAEPDTDGSKANGMDYVPYDGYIARLHKGERVMTRTENAMFSKGVNNGNTVTNNNTITVYAELSGHEIVEKLEQVGIYVKNLRG